MMSEPSSRTKKALAHLNSLKPHDGWSTDTYISSSNKVLTILKRRNVPLSDSGYVEIAVEKDMNRVVGIVSHIGETDSCGYARAAILVEKDGTVCRKKGEVTRVTLEKVNLDDATSNNEVKRRKESTFKKEIQKNLVTARQSKVTQNRGRSQPLTPPTNRNNGGTLSEEQNKELIQLVGCILGVATLLRIVSNIFSSAFILVVPLVVLYAMQTCPANETFDAKKELKRVLRGAHLPEDHPDKPKNWFTEGLARFQASVTAEVATGLGHEVSFINIFGAFTLVTVYVPVMSMNLYFVGGFNNWKYILHMNTEPPRQS